MTPTPPVNVNDNKFWRKKMVKLKGQIVGESDKAVKLEITEDEYSKLLGKIKWMPKSQLRLDGKEVGIVIPEWLYEQKVNEKMKRED